MERKKKERNKIWLQKPKKMKEQRRKETYSGCSDLRQIQDGTDTFQGRKPHVRGTRSRNPPSTPAKVDWVIESLNEECMSLWCVDECPWHSFVNSCQIRSLNTKIEWRKSVKASPESFEAQEPHCAHPRRRCTPRRTSGPPPWRSWADDEPASATDDSWFGIEKENFPSFFIWKFWKVWNWVSHALMYSVFKSFQSWHTLLGIIFSQKLSWNPFKRVKTSWWCSTI